MGQFKLQKYMKILKSIFSKSIIFLAILSTFHSAKSIAESPSQSQETLVQFEEALSENCDTCIVEDRWQFGVALGIGYISTPIAQEDDTLLPIIPRFSYYGEKFFIDNFTIGYSFLESNSQRLDLIGEFNQDFLHFETASDIQKAFASFTRLSGQVVIIDVGDYELKPRHATYLVGPAYSFNGENWFFKAKYGVDSFNVNGGAEASIEIGQNFSVNRWNFEHSLGATWKSKEIVEYYYGLDRDEAPAIIAMYEPTESALNPFYRINTQYQINDDWRFLVSYKTERLDEVIVESNIVNEESVDSVFIGVGYDF